MKIGLSIPLLFVILNLTSELLVLNAYAKAYVNHLRTQIRLSCSLCWDVDIQKRISKYNIVIVLRRISNSDLDQLNKWPYGRLGWKTYLMYDDTYPVAHAVSCMFMWYYDDMFRCDIMRCYDDVS